MKEFSKIKLCQVSLVGVFEPSIRLMDEQNVARYFLGSTREESVQLS